MDSMAGPLGEVDRAIVSWSPFVLHLTTSVTHPIIYFNAVSTLFCLEVPQELSMML